MSSLLIQSLVQNHLSRVRPIQLRHFPLLLIRAFTLDWSSICTTKWRLLSPVDPPLDTNVWDAGRNKADYTSCYKSVYWYCIRMCACALSVYLCVGCFPPLIYVFTLCFLCDMYRYETAYYFHYRNVSTQILPSCSMWMYFRKVCRKC